MKNFISTFKEKQQAKQERAQTIAIALVFAALLVSCFFN